MKKTLTGFTIVELIVVITILAVLGAVGFVSYTSHLGTTRDATRSSQIQIIYQAFEGYSKGKLPLPDDNVKVNANGTLIGYQGEVGETVLSTLGINNGGRDPYDNSYYTYFIDKKQKNVQVLTFLENRQSIGVSYNPFVDQAKATDLSSRIPTPFGKKLGVLVESGTNIPIQDISVIKTSGLDVVTTTSNYKAIFSQDKVISGSGRVLQMLQQSILYGGTGFGAPKSCPEGFIAVPGNSDFNQPGFCVMKYEATYEDATVPTQATYASVNFQLGKIPVSKPGLFPIGTGSQLEAISACKSIGAGYHLITNNEWMTIARNIESQGSNWSNNKVGSGGIFVGLNHVVNSLGCSAENSLGMYNAGRTSGAATLTTDTTKWGSSKGSDCDSKRQLILSNGEIIWDLSGNLREHVNGANTLDGSNNATMLGATCSGIGPGIATEFNVCIFVSPYSYASQGPKTSNLTTAYGIGRIYAHATNSMVFLRGNSDNTDGNGEGGVYTLYNGWYNSSKNVVVGFRCAK